VVTDVHRNVTPRLIDLESFVTACYARFDLEARHVEFVDCGHPRTLHYHARTGLCDSLEGSNLPLGFVTEHVYEQQAVAFETGDLFVMYSDGLTEARAPSGEMFGPDRLRELIVSMHDQCPTEVVEKVEHRIREFAGEDVHGDDLSVVALRIGEPVQRRSLDRRSGFRDRRGRRELTVARAVASLQEAREFILDGLRSPRPLREGFVPELQLAVQEILTNIIRHGSENVETPVTIGVELLGDRAAVQILYEGEFFRPERTAVIPDLREYPESGFGLYLIEHFVDSAAYSRGLDGRNCIHLVKTF